MGETKSLSSRNLLLGGSHDTTKCGGNVENLIVHFEAKCE